MINTLMFVIDLPPPPVTGHGAPRDTRTGGRPFRDALLMFKILMLRELYALSDEKVEFQIAGRLTVQRFLKLGIEHAVPDYTAV